VGVTGAVIRRTGVERGASGGNPAGSRGVGARRRCTGQDKEKKQTTTTQRSDSASVVQVYQRIQAEKAPRIPGYSLLLGSFQFPRTASLRPGHVPLTLLVHRATYHYTRWSPQTSMTAAMRACFPRFVGQSAPAESAPVRAFSCQPVAHQRISLRYAFNASAYNPSSSPGLHSIATTSTVACAATVDAASSALQRRDCVPRPAPSPSTALLASPPPQASHLSSRACTILGKS
jgi:hypothetical protein